MTADSIPCKSFWTKPSIFMHELLQLFVSMAATVYGDNAPIKLNYMYTELYVSVVDLLLFVWSRTDLTCFFCSPPSPALSTFTYLTRWDPSKTKKISSDKCGIRICLRLQFLIYKLDQDCIWHILEKCWISLLLLGHWF